MGLGKSIQWDCQVYICDNSCIVQRAFTSIGNDFILIKCVRLYIVLSFTDIVLL